MRASLLVAFVAAQFDYSSYQKQYASSSGGNSSHDASGQMDWHKYAGANGNWSKYAGASGDWKKYWNGSKSEMGNGSDTYDGPFQSDDSILKLKGNITALKAKEKEVEHAVDQVKKFVPVKFQAAPLGQYKKDLSDIHRMIKEAEKEKKEAEKEKKEAEKEKEEEEKKNETKGEEKKETPEPSTDTTSKDGTVAKGTAFLARSDLLTVVDEKVDTIEDQIKQVKKHEDEIKKYVPAEYQPQALNSTKGELAVLEAKLTAAKLEEAKEEKEKEAKEAKEEKESEEAKEKEEKKETNATSSKHAHKNSSKTDSADLVEADAGAALLATERSTSPSLGNVSVCFCATVSVLSLLVAFRRRPVNIDQRPLLG